MASTLKYSVMPPQRKKALTYNCKQCKFVMTGNDKDNFRNTGFDHQMEKHSLVEENRDWFNNHIANYYAIS